jgi:8-oxo-dGTP diphosphatase
MDTRVGCYGWIEQDGRVLLTHWMGNPEGASPGWTLPGGGMELGETTEQTALREVAEETGYVVELEELLGTDSIYISAEDRLLPGDGPLHGLRIIYRARIVGGTLTVETDGSTDDARWFGPDELETLGCVDLVHAARRLAGW